MTMDETALQRIKQEAKAEGRTERNSYLVKSLFQSTNFEDEKIAALAGVSLEFVREKKKELYSPYLTFSKTEEISIQLMKQDKVDIRKYFEKKEALITVWDSNGEFPEAEVRALFKVDYL